MAKCGYTYIMTNQPFGTLYIGVTNDLRGRIHAHRTGTRSTFTCKYDLTNLVWFEAYDLITDAIKREKQLKAWRRAWKIALIEENNPDWHDLYPSIALG